MTEPRSYGPGFRLRSDWGFSIASGEASASNAALDHQLLQLGYCLGRIKSFRACLSAIQDGVAAVEAEGILQVIQSVAGRLVTAVNHPAVGLQQNGRA